MADSVPVRPSLVGQFDEIVAASNILCSGTEGGECGKGKVTKRQSLPVCSLSSVFGQFVANHMDQYRDMEITKAENRRLKSENAAKEIKIKLSRCCLPKIQCWIFVLLFRNSYDEMMKKREESELTVRQYVSTTRLCTILVLLE